MKKLISLTLVLFMCISCFASCGKTNDDEKNDAVETGKIITKAEIEDALGDDYYGTLSIEGPADNVKSFKYVISDIGSEYLIDKAVMRKIILIFLEDVTKLPYNQIKTALAFSDTWGLKMLIDPNDENLSITTEIEDVLEILCDGKSKQYDNWTISASVNKETDSLTIYVTSK